MTPSTQLSPIYKKMNKFMKDDEGQDEGDEEVVESSDESICKLDKNKAVFTYNIYCSAM